MAEFLERRKVVKKEKQLGSRVNTLTKQTKKKRYSDARDEDLKVMKESEQLANELQELATVRETRKTLKKSSGLSGSKKEKPDNSRPTGSKEGYNFDDLKE